MGGQSFPKSVTSVEWKILLIDNDEDDFLIVRDMLKEAKGRNFDIQWADTYTAGRGALISNQYHAVLVDYDLGQHSGIELIREINERGYASPLILFTGRGSYEIDIEAMQAGATMYLTKGEVNPLLLERSIRYAMELKQKEQDLRVREANLRESEQKSREILESISDGFLSFDRDWRVMYINSQAAEQGGYRAEDLIGSIIWDSVPQLRGSNLETVYRKVMQERSPQTTEYQNPKTGKWFRLRVYPSTDGISVFTLDVTVEKKTEEELRRQSQALQESEARLRDQYEELNQIYRYAPVGLFTFDRQYRFLRINERMAEINGLSVEEHIGKSVDVVVPELAEGFKEIYEPVLERGEPVLYVDVHGKTPKDPTKERDWLCNYFPLKSGTGEVVGLIGAVLEVTERKQAEEELRQSRELLRAIIDNANAAIFAKDLQGRFILSNLYHAALLHRTPDQVIGLLDADFTEIAPQAGAYLCDDRRVIDEGRPVEFEEMAPGLDGKEHTYFTIKFPLRDSSGTIYGVCGISSDITQRKQMEEKLQESESRFRVALSSAPISVYTTDNHLRLTWMYAPQPGFQPEYVVGLRLDEVIPGETGRELVEIQKKVLETGEPQQGELDAWVEGKLTAYAYYTDPIRDAAGNIIGLACAGYDVSDRKQAERNLQHYAHELERSNQALQDFAFIASHDLQEPLRKIVMFGNSLRRQTGQRMDQESLDYVDRMQKAAKRMQTMIHGLLELSRVNIRGGDFQPVDLNPLVEEVVSDLEVRVKAVGGQVKIDQLPSVEADELQMRQLFQNLIGNAIKFHKPGVPPVVHVTGLVDRTKKPHKISIEVKDNGIGFDQEHKERIFQPFQRLHTRREYEGTGLGLAICQKIIERHHGSIEVQSVPGQGSSFIVHLPLKRSA